MPTVRGQRDWDRDCRTFARELLLARHAGYLEWIDPFDPGVRALDPIIDAQQWPQQARDIRLTLDGSLGGRCTSPAQPPRHVVTQNLSRPFEPGELPAVRAAVERLAAKAQVPVPGCI